VEIKMATTEEIPLPSIRESLISSRKRTYDMFAATNKMALPENVET
jgi:hypothetical protein